MPKTNVVRIQDSVHGLMEFRDMETGVVEILHTPEIQRLRRVKQLGLVHLVFPAAEHSRFVHSLGTSYLALRFSKHIQETCYGDYPKELIPDESTKRDFSIAALCHDIGHGPLSHMWEREIVGDEYDVKKWINGLELDESEFTKRINGEEKIKWHELIAQAILNWEKGDLHQLLEIQESGFSKRLRHLLNGEYYIPYLPKLMVGDIDIDRADYIRRDTHQTGVAYGRYDLDWLISTCTLASDSNNLVVGFDEKKGMRVVEQFLMARRALYDTVYFHKTVRCADGMMALFLRRLKKYLLSNDLKNVQSINLVKKIVSGNILNVAEVLRLDDNMIWSIVDAVTKVERIDEILKDLAQRILNRSLFKIVPCESGKVNEFLASEHGREKIYDVIKPYCLGDPEYYLVVDRKKFSMLADEKSSSYLINKGGYQKIRFHNLFSQYARDSMNEVRLFTLEEAVDDVKQLIG